MSNRIVAAAAAAAFSAYAAAALVTISPSVALADEAGSFYGAKTIGALSRETVGLATSADVVARQGGGATASTVRWTSGPVAPAGAVYGFGSVGAMVRETAGLATSQDQVVRQSRGLVTAVPAIYAEAPRVGS